MNIRKTFTQVIFIIILSIIFGFANNYFNPNGIKIAFERPATAVAADSTLESRYVELAEPIVLNKQQLKQRMAQDDVVIIDTRSPQEFESGHINGAINIPFDQLGEYIDKIDALPKDKWIVTYCEGPPCEKGEMLARELFYMDFHRVAYYDAGLNDWMTTEDIAQ